MYNAPENPQPSYRSKPWPIREIILCVVLFGAGIAVGYAWRGASAGTPSVDASLDESAFDDPAMGAADAKVVIQEFADYECGYCRLFYQQVFKPLMERYKDRVRFVFRDFVAPIGPNSEQTALAANCAAEQGRFWDYQELLWGGEKDFSSTALTGYARILGLDMTAFSQCVADNRFADEMRLDRLDGMRQGIGGTPSFLVNDQLIPGMLPLEDFAAVVEQELARAGG
jgi:protein-disulfide isomerase